MPQPGCSSPSSSPTSRRPSAAIFSQFGANGSTGSARVVGMITRRPLAVEKRATAVILTHAERHLEGENHRSTYAKKPTQELLPGRPLVRDTLLRYKEVSADCSQQITCPGQARPAHRASMAPRPACCYLRTRVPIRHNSGYRCIVRRGLAHTSPDRCSFPGRARLERRSRTSAVPGTGRRRKE